MLRDAVAAALLSLACGLNSSTAQDTRSGRGSERPTRRDLAARLRLLEGDILERPDAFAERRRGIATRLSGAVAGFFTGAFGRVMDGINDARAHLREEPFDATRAALERIRLSLPLWIALDAKAPNLTGRLVPLGAPPPDDLILGIAVALGKRGTSSPAGPWRRLRPRPFREWAETAIDLGPAPGAEGLLRVILDLSIVDAGAATTPEAAEGRGRPAGHILAEMVLVGPGTRDAWTRLGGRIASLPESLPEGSTPGLLATVRRLRDRIDAAFAGRAGDLVPDIPADVRHAAALVACIDADDDGTPRLLRSSDVPRDSHRATARGARYRLLAPKGAVNPGGVPLVLVLHGAGGNEDMFFDACGAGEAVRQAERRGFALASPETPSDAVEVLEDVATFLPIDRSRVHLIGHSMGAGAAWAALLAAPRRFASITAIAGGWMSPASPDWSAAVHVPVLVVNGELDPARGGALRTANRAAAAGVAVTRLDLPDLDHLLVVGASLPEIFRFLEARRRMP